MSHSHTYRLVIEKETSAGGKNRAVYNAYCPTLGLADWGATIDEAIAHITKLISFHIESLSVRGHRIPEERDMTTVITSVSVPMSVSKKLIRA